MESCWDAKPDSRPTFSVILSTIDHLLESSADYVDLTGLRADEKLESREHCISVPDNDYNIAGNF